MIHRLTLKVSLLALAGNLFLPFFAQADAPAAGAPLLETAGEAVSSERATNVFRPIRPGPADGRIAYVVAQMLQQVHYSRQPFNDKVSAKFLDRYLEMLDPQKLHFTQDDLQRFDLYRTNLDNMTIAMSRRGLGDPWPGCEIFNRFMMRLQERVEFVDAALKTETFDFSTDEKITLNRKDVRPPADLAEAKSLWLQRLRFEYLQEKLGKIDARKKADAARLAALPDAHPGTNAVVKPKTEHEEIVETLHNRYSRNLRTFKDWDNDDVLQIYLTALAHVYDPHSDYLGPSQLDTFSIGMNLSLFGIGAELFAEDGYCTIRRLLPGGPAEKSKSIKEKDRIVAVAQSNQPPVDVVEMSLTKAVQLIRGPKGTEVTLTIIPAGSSSSTRKTLTLVRDEIKLEDQEAKAKIIDLPDAQGHSARLGVIDLPSFYATFDPSNKRGKSEPRSTTADVAKLLSKLKQENVNGVILDLRRNGGGSLEEAIRLTGLFIKQGPVVQVKDMDGKIQEESDRDSSVTYEGPLIVLTSRFSASASEILAGALQDYGRALVVGDISTHGKGTVQSVNDLKPFMNFGNIVITNDPGALKLTIKKFYRASGASTQREGVKPDIILPSVLNESKEIGEAALDSALEYDTIKKADYIPVNMVQPYLGELLKRSHQRINASKDFVYVREDIDLFKKRQEDKTVSLNLEARLREKAEDDARQKARDRERLARAETHEKVYDITLKNAVLPGLPPPEEKTNALAKAASLRLAGGDTNAVASSTSEITPSADPLDPSSSDSDEPKPPAQDVNLIEAERILVDYLSLLAKHELVSTKPLPVP
jgi:carboxyl-terminal processing protease